MAARQSLVREGVMSGVIGATSVAVWFLILDTIAGRPFHTPRVLGTLFFSVLGPSLSIDPPALVVAGYTAFLKLYGATVGLHDVGGFFVLYGNLWVAVSSIASPYIVLGTAGGTVRGIRL